MKNLYQEILFECSTFRHKPIAGQMRFWHVHQHNCYPRGCESDDGFHIPKLLVSEDEYQDFLKRFNEFCSWTKKMRSRIRISFTGIIDHIYPYFSVKMVESSPIFECKEFVLVFKQGLIRKEFFEGPFYVVVSWSFLEKLNLEAKDTVSGLAHFNIDQRGIITLDRVARIRLINSFIPHVKWDSHKFDGLNLRFVDYLYQDLCMECSHKFLAQNWNARERKRTNIFICTRGSCIYRQAEDSLESDLPGTSDPDNIIPEENSPQIKGEIYNGSAHS